MTIRDMITLVPKKKRLSNKLKKLLEKVKHLQKEVDEVRDILNEIEGITIYKQTPLYVIPAKEVVQVVAVDDKINRSAFIFPRTEGESTLYRVRLHGNGFGDGGEEIGVYKSKNYAMKMGKDWVVFGNHG